MMLQGIKLRILISEGLSLPEKEYCKKIRQSFSPEKGPICQYVLVITDSREEGARCEKEGHCCIGLERSECSRFFPGADLVVRGISEDLLPLSLCVRTVCHHYGLPFVIRENERFLLRECCRNDADHVKRLFEQGRKTLKNPGDIEDFDNWFASHLLTAYRWQGYGLMVLASSASVIGIASMEADEEDEIVQLGIIIDEPYRGRGIGRQYLNWLLDYADELGFAGAKILTGEENLRMRRLAEEQKFDLRSRCTDETGRRQVEYYRRL